MSLLKLQRELAALLLEEPARRAFARDRKGHARRRGLRGKEAQLLAGLDADDVAYFASRRQVDRALALGLDLPRTSAELEAEGRLRLYFRAFPYALEDPLEETARVARWARQAARRGAVSGLAADLATVEAAMLALRARPYRAPKRARRPRRAPGVRLLRLGHDVGEALHGHAPEARPTLAVLVRTPDDVVAGEVDPVAFATLRAADGRRSEAEVVAYVARAAEVPKAKAAAALRALRREGLLAPAA